MARYNPNVSSASATPRQPVPPRRQQWWRVLLIGLWILRRVSQGRPRARAAQG